METLKEYYYTYYSYEEWGRGYFGSRGCKCLPEEDIKYLGSSRNKTFKPTHKIILKDDYATREEAYADEIILQQHYKVVENPHFANRSYQTSTGFTTSGIKVTDEYRQKMSKVTKGENNGMYGKKRPDLAERNRQMKGIKRPNTSGNRKNMCGENNHMYGKKRPDVSEKNKEKKGKKQNITDEERNRRSEMRRMLNYKNTDTPANQKWECLETGFITNAGNLAKYQRARGIDTSKRRRIL